MNRRRALSLLVATVTVLSLAVGSGSFTAVEADRGVSVEVVNDSEAYVGYNSSDINTIETGDEIDLVNITNRFNTNFTVEHVTVTTVAGDAEIEPNPNDITLSPGESKYLTGKVIECSGGTSTIQVTVEVNGGSVWAAIYGDYKTREFNVTCPSVEGVWFNGAGTVNVETAGLDKVDIHYWTTEDKPAGGNGNGDGPQNDNSANNGDNSGDDSGPISVTKTDTTVTVDTNINENLESGQKTVVAVEIPGYGVIYAHPGYNLDTGEVDDWGAGDGQQVDEFPTVE